MVQKWSFPYKLAKKSSNFHEDFSPFPPFCRISLSPLRDKKIPSPLAKGPYIWPQAHVWLNPKLKQFKHVLIFFKKNID